MRKSFLLSIIFVFFLSMLAMSNCQSNVETPKPMDVRFKWQPQSNNCGVDTFIVYAKYWIPDDPYWKNKNYILYFEGYRNGTVDLTSDTLVLNDVPFIDTMGLARLKWYGEVSSGDYWVKIRFKKMSKEESSRNDSTEAWVVSDGKVPINNINDEIIVKWCGDMRYGNPGEPLYQPAAYPIFVQVINKITQQPLPNRSVFFQTTAGVVYPDSNITGWINVPFTNENVEGLANTYLLLPDEAQDITITASYDTHSAYFNLKAVVDDEVVTDTLLIHECWTDTSSAQISGDGLWGTPDSSSTGKDLVVEIDYDYDVISQSVINAAMALVRDSLFAPIGVTVRYYIDGSFKTPLTVSRGTLKQMLSYYRNQDYTGIGKGALHLMFARKFNSPAQQGDSNNIWGIAVTYSDQNYENRGGTTCAQYGSGDMSSSGYSQAFLDSVGCFVFVAPTCNIIPQSFVDSAHILALVTAHEIGHGIGLGHTNDSIYKYHGIMSYGIDRMLGYNSYAYFDKPVPPDYTHRWLIDIRKVLGRETVDFNW